MHGCTHARARPMQTLPTPTFSPQMLVDDIGDVTISNDGATILKLLEIEHPAAKVGRARASAAAVGAHAAPLPPQHPTPMPPHTHQAPLRPGLQALHPCTHAACPPAHRGGEAAGRDPLLPRLPLPRRSWWSWRSCRTRRWVTAPPASSSWPRSCSSAPTSWSATGSTPLTSSPATGWPCGRWVGGPGLGAGVGCGACACAARGQDSWAQADLRALAAAEAVPPPPSCPRQQLRTVFPAHKVHSPSLRKRPSPILGSLQACKFIDEHMAIRTDKLGKVGVMRGHQPRAGVLGAWFGASEGGARRREAASIAPAPARDSALLAPCTLRHSPRLQPALVGHTSANAVTKRARPQAACGVAGSCTRTHTRTLHHRRTPSSPPPRPPCPPRSWARTLTFSRKWRWTRSRCVRGFWLLMGAPLSPQCRRSPASSPVRPSVERFFPSSRLHGVQVVGGTFVRT